MGFVLIGILLKIYSKTLQENLLKHESTIIHVFSIVSSQGLALTYNHIFRRIIAFTGQLLVIMVLNIYAGQLLNVILTPANDPFSSRDDLLNSDIHLARYTTWGIAIILFVSKFFLLLLRKLSSVVYVICVETTRDNESTGLQRNLLQLLARSLHKDVR